MTALKQFQRLEAQGTWRKTPAEQKREVIVSVGDATLVLTDPKSEVPLSHWSIPAAVRLNPGKWPARYSPGEDDDEELEISDELMIASIEKVHQTIESHRAHPGRLRGGLLLGGVAAMALAAVLWLPQAVVRHAAKIAPPAQQSEIGRDILTEVTRITGARCDRPAASAALTRVAEKLMGPGSDIAVLRAPLRGARMLPGGIVIVSEDVIATPDGPEAMAGYVLAADATAVAQSPLLDALTYAGPRAAVTLLTSGKLPEKALAGYGETLLSQGLTRPDDSTLIERFAAAGISSEPYARAVDPSGEATLGLIEADPFRTRAPQPLMPDGDWVIVQAICD